MYETHRGPQHRGEQRRAPLRRAAQPPAVTALLAAQQGAGNAAVTRAIAARRVLARSQDPETEADPEFRELYEAKLREGIGLLEGVAFGRAEGSHVMADNGDHYDARNWAVMASTGNGTADAMLVLRRGVLPSKAIDDLFADLGGR